MPVDAEGDMTMLKGALWYARHGWPVFPCYSWDVVKQCCGCGVAECESPAKHPMTVHGLKDATVNQGIIRHWWAQWPAANIGVVTGKASGLVVLDVDTYDGGEMGLETWLGEHGPLPDTVESHTGGGGRHLLFARPGGEIRNKVRLGTGLDVRGDGGYIIVPPSLHKSGERYVWEASSSPKDVKVAPLPAWLCEILSEPERPQRPSPDDHGTIQHGQRNDTLTRMAGAMRRHGMAPSVIESALMEENLRRCVPPLAAEEVKRIALSISRYTPAPAVETGARSSRLQTGIPKDTAKELLGLEDIGERLIWVASREEKAMVQAAGYRSCVAVPEIPPVTGNYQRHLNYLKTLEPCLTADSRHLFLLPNTLDGRALTAELSRRLGPELCLGVSWPSECDTVEHIVTVYGMEVLQETIEGALPLPIRGIVELTSLRQTLHDWYAGKRIPRGVNPGWDNLKQIYRVRPGEITLISGAPSTGKSTFVSALLVNLVQQYGWPVTIFSPEQAPPARYAVTLLEQACSWPFDEGPQERMTLDTLDRTLDELSRYMTLIWPEDDSPTVDFLLEMARKEALRRGIKGFVIDPWNEVDHDQAPGQREDQYIGKSLTKIRRFARLHGVHVWILVHPKTMFKDPKTEKYPVPTPYDISGGAKWRDKADNILALWRELSGPNERVLQVHTQKIKFRENGVIGKVAELSYHPATGRYTEMGNPRDPA